MINYDSLLIDSNASVSEAVSRLDEATHQGFYPLLIIIDKKKKLVGTITDGDVRRYLLKHGNLNKTILEVGNLNPISFGQDEPINKSLIEKYRVIPVVNNNGTLINVYTTKKKNSSSLANVNVVINAGGFGSRLSPYTNIIPKPLIPIRNKAIIDHIISFFIEHGAMNFHVIVNYKNSIIKSYLDEVWPSININILKETSPLGTLGGLSLLRRLKDDCKTIVLSNCDILITHDFDKIIDYHLNHANDITIVSVEYEFVLPYGVLEQDKNSKLINIFEKPSQKHLINSGIYLLNRKEIDTIEEATVLDMNTFLEDKLLSNKNIGIYTIRFEEWFDMGTPDGLHRMKEAFESD
jgi:dTDP-glucose pyrophosphorylase